jgi:hypothetical protein
MKNANMPFNTTVKTAITALLCAFAVVACDKNDGNNNQYGNNGQQGVVANIPTSDSCFAGVQGQNGYQNGYQNQYQQNPNWQSYQNGGFQQYNYDWRHRQNYGGSGWPQGTNPSVGCGYGQIPVCSPGVGMTCVSNQQVGNYNMSWYGWNGGGNQFVQCGYGQGSNYGPAYGNNNSCGYNQLVGQGCMVGNPNSCGGYGYCQAVNGSQAGVCVH